MVKVIGTSSVTGGLSPEGAGSETFPAPELEPSLALRNVFLPGVPVGKMHTGRATASQLKT